MASNIDLSAHTFRNTAFLATHAHRCDPVMLADLLFSAAPPTLDCLLGTVLPAVVTRISSGTGTGAVSTSGETGSDSNSSRNSRSSGVAGVGTATGAPRSSSSRGTAAVHAICRLAASVAASVSSTTAREGEGKGGADPVQFRDKISGSELRKLGPLGRDAEVALAEAFFYREGEGPTFF